MSSRKAARSRAHGDRMPGRRRRQLCRSELRRRAEGGEKFYGAVAAPAGIGPDAKATLQLADAGKTVCLRHGDVLTVFLAAPPDEVAWTPIRTSSRRVVEPRSVGVLTLVRGVTGAVFRASARGIATLTSTRPPCTRQTIKSCDAAHVWRATVEIKR